MFKSLGAPENSLLEAGIDIYKFIFGLFAQMNFGGHFSGGENRDSRGKDGSEADLQDEEPSGTGIACTPKRDRLLHLADLKVGECKAGVVIANELRQGVLQHQSPRIIPAMVLYLKIRCRLIAGQIGGSGGDHPLEQFLFLSRVES